MSGYLDMELLRFTTCGSVDDGKSTLIGRLLYDSKAIFADQMEALELSCRMRGDDTVDLALLTDGLRAEREQGITIDVAYRYFATDKRKFIIADTPGHIQYTRNMVTGASTADLAIVLIDARQGLITQSKRHSFLASLLGIKHLLVAVNKMDLVGWSKETYDAICKDFVDYSQKLDIHDIKFIPISALTGANVADPSNTMPWYLGDTVLQHLETVHVASDRNLVDFRYPVQYVIRPDQDFRGYAGLITSGAISPGEEIIVLPSKKKSRVKTIETFDGKLQEAVTPQSVVITLEDEIDVSRGDMIVKVGNVPTVTTTVDATICWMAESSIESGMSYLLRHGPQEVTARVNKVLYRIDMDNLHREDSDNLGLNDIGRVELRLSKSIYTDAYTSNRTNGNFILIDPSSHETVGAGMVRISSGKTDKSTQSTNTKWHLMKVTRRDREKLSGHKAQVLWFTGLSASGKSTIASALEAELHALGLRTYLLDGDNVRQGLCGDLGFSDIDRTENIRRVGETAQLLYDAGSVVLCTFISPIAKDRAIVKSLFPEGKYSEVYVKCDIEVCKQRDPKGLYKKAIAGEIPQFTGISSVFEEPVDPDITIRSDLYCIQDIVKKLVSKVVSCT